jgi:hypothetical protein
MSSHPTLTVAPAHAVDTASPLWAAALPVDPETRTGCTWWVVPAPGAVQHPHAA